jgi:MYXO-CTERM domain-containing protein
VFIIKSVIYSGIALAALGLFTAPASASALDATADMTAVADGANWDYTITLTNTGTGPIGTFWYAWVPGAGYLPTMPTNIVAPANWVDTITNGPPPSDGFSIQFTESGTSFGIAPGSSLQFTFSSTSSPATLAGLSAIHPPTPIGTSTIFGGAPFSDAGQSFVVTSGVTSAVPEPSTLAFGLVSIASLAALRRRRKNTK